MKELNQEFDAKMKKTIDVVVSDLPASVPAVPTPPCWTRSPWTTTAPPLP